MDMGFAFVRIEVDRSALAGTKEGIRNVEEELKILGTVAAALGVVVLLRDHFRLAAELEDEGVRVCTTRYAPGVFPPRRYSAGLLGDRPPPRHVIRS